MHSDDTRNDLPAGAICAPNFFVLGAGRCGSSTLYSMLRQHPEVFMSEVKEPSFFCSYFRVVDDPISYFNLFRPSHGEKAVGEASHLYLSNPESCEVIHALFPRAKFILIFRNPTDRAYSLYHWTRRAKLEPKNTFEKALEAEGQRFADEKFFKNCPQYFWNFMYVRSSYYHEQWESYLRYYSRDHFFCLGLTELKSDPLQEMQRVYEFLDVDPSFQPFVEHLNGQPYPPMLEATRQRLDEHFDETIRATEALAGRDLGLRIAKPPRAI